MSDVSTNIVVRKKFSVWKFIVSFFTAFFVLLISTFFSTNLSIENICVIGVISFVLSIIDFFVIKFSRFNYSSLINFIIGLSLSLVILYITQFFVSGYDISWISIIFGACIYGLVDSCF